MKSVYRLRQESDFSVTLMRSGNIVASLKLASRNPLLILLLNDGISIDSVLREESTTAIDKANIIYDLEMIAHMQLIEYVLFSLNEGEEIVLCTKGGSLKKAGEISESMNDLIRLTKYAYFRSDKGNMLCESPTSYSSILVGHSKTARLMGDLTFGTPIKEFQISLEEYLGDYAKSFISILIAGKFAQIARSGEPEFNEVVEFQDVLFHSWSRVGLPYNDFGGTYANRHAIQQIMSSEKEDFSEGRRFSALINKSECCNLLRETFRNRTSNWIVGRKGISFSQLSDFLITSLSPNTSEDIERTETRPYPSGGGFYEIEVYVTLRENDFLDDGTYKFNPLDNSFIEIATSKEKCHQYLKSVGRSWGGGSLIPNTVLTYTADIYKLLEKYEGLAYRIVLLNAGALLQTMYLVATEMELGPCAVSGVDPRIFTDIVKRNDARYLPVIDFVLEVES